MPGGAVGGGAGGPVGGVRLAVPPQLESDSIDPETTMIITADASHRERRRIGSRSSKTPPQSTMPVLPKAEWPAMLLLAAVAAVVEMMSCVLASEPCTGNVLVPNPQVGGLASVPEPR